MRRTACCLAALATSMCLIGCQEPHAEMTMQDSSAGTGVMEPDFYAADPAATASTDGGYGSSGSYGSYGDSGSYGGTSTYGSDTSYTEFPAAGDSTSSGSAMAGSGMGGGSVHHVAKGDTLFSLARSYYNDQSRWKDIYEANRDKIGDPNRIRVGDELVIP